MMQFDIDAYNEIQQLKARVIELEKVMRRCQTADLANRDSEAYMLIEDALNRKGAQSDVQYNVANYIAQSENAAKEMNKTVQQMLDEGWVQDALGTWHSPDGKTIRE